MMDIIGGLYLVIGGWSLGYLDGSDFGTGRKSAVFVRIMFFLAWPAICAVAVYKWCRI